MFGFHMSIAKGGLDSVMAEMKAIGCPTTQIFIRSPQQYKFKSGLKVTDKHVEFFEDKKVFTHGQYVLKMATLTNAGKINEYNVKSLANDIAFLYKLDGIGVVVHIGKSTGDKKVDFINVQKLILKTYDVFKNIDDDMPKTILENRAKAGDLVLTTVEDMIEFWNFASTECKKRIGFCFDTCHDFVTTSVLSRESRTKRKTIDFNLRKLIKGVGVENVLCIHFNDSKSDKLDRHAGYLEGIIPPKELQSVIKIIKKYNLPAIVEKHKWTMEKKKKLYITLLEQI